MAQAVELRTFGALIGLDAYLYAIALQYIGK